MGIIPGMKDRLQFILLGPRDLLLYLVCKTYRTFLWGFQRLPPRYLDWASRTRARRPCRRTALSRIPARTSPKFSTRLSFSAHGIAI